MVDDKWMQNVSLKIGNLFLALADATAETVDQAKALVIIQGPTPNDISTLIQKVCWLNEMRSVKKGQVDKKYFLTKQEIRACFPKLAAFATKG